jgi:hypothetical protein
VLRLVLISLLTRRLDHQLAAYSAGPRESHLTDRRGAAAAGAGLLTAYLKFVRPWARRWGATAEEAARPLPGDKLVTKADYVATRAITIHAPPHEVWPWLVQIGSGRAGWYTYDRIDNACCPRTPSHVGWRTASRVGRRKASCPACLS